MSDLVVTARSSCGLVVAAGLVTGCLFSGDLGNSCDGELDCSYGLRCYQESGASKGVCTERCDAGACSDGVCFTADEGDICVKECRAVSDCDSGQACQIAEDGAWVCWRPDPSMTDVEEGVTVASLELGELTQSNSDGLASPGEDLRFAVVARNTTGRTLTGVWASLNGLPEGVALTTCFGAGDGNSGQCQVNGELGTCDCEFPNNPAYRNTLESGADSRVAVLAVTFAVEPGISESSLSFPITFHDDNDAFWTESVVIDLVEPNTEISIASSDIVVDPNENGFIDDGEVVDIEIIPQNSGGTRGYRVSADVELQTSGYSIYDCYRVGSGNGGDCLEAATSCECHVGSSLDYYQDIEGGETLDGPLTRLRVRRDGGTDPLSVLVTFRDELGYSWQDTFVVPNAGAAR